MIGYSAGRPPIYRLTDRLRHGHPVRVPAHEITATVSAWLAEVGADSPLVDGLARGAWRRLAGSACPRCVSECLSVEVAVAG